MDFYTLSVAGVASAVGFLTAAVLFRRRDYRTLSKTASETAICDTASDDGGQKMVILVRTDLNMTKGKAAAQCCHAVLSAYKQAARRSPKMLAAWEADGQPKVTLRTDSQEELEALQRRAREAGLVAESIRDAGRTQLVPGTKTVCAIGPGPIKLINLITGHLKLY